MSSVINYLMRYEEDDKLVRDLPSFLRQKHRRSFVKELNDVRR